MAKPSLALHVALAAFSGAAGAQLVDEVVGKSPACSASNARDDGVAEGLSATDSAHAPVGNPAGPRHVIEALPGLLILQKQGWRPEAIAQAAEESHAANRSATSPHPPRLNRPVHTATGGDHPAIPESHEHNDVRGGGTY